MSNVFAYIHENGLYLNITNRCTFRCVFCLRDSRKAYEGQELWLKQEPEAQDVIAAIEAKGGANKFDEVVFCGFGEPTMRLAVLLETARIIRERWPATRIRLNTNGQGSLVAGHDIAPELKGLVDTVSISLNAPTAEEYVAVSRPAHGEQSFYAMLDFAKACRAQGLDTVMTVVDSIGKEKVEASRKVAEALGVRFRVREYIPEEG
jgi:TatD family-associated radical SAM protein